MLILTEKRLVSNNEEIGCSCDLLQRELMCIIEDTMGIVPVDIT